MPIDAERVDPAAAARPEPSPAQPVSNAGSTVELPTWFELALVVAVSATVAGGGAGLALAVLGHYHLWSAAALGLPGAAVLTALAWPVRQGTAARRRASHIPTAVMTLVALAFMLWNGLLAGHYVWVDRDPGVYATTGSWLARYGTLEVPAGGAWSAVGREFGWTSAGMYPEPGGIVEFQFSHLTGVLLAEARGVGGDRLMFALPAVLGALALCAVYAVGVRLLHRPWLAVAATATVGESLPELFVSRDTYSETSAQLLLWGGLWLLLTAFRRRSARTALAAGAAIGAILMSRIDALVYFVPLPVLAAVVWLARPSRPDRAFLLRAGTAVILGALPPIALATADVKLRATGYYTALHSQVSLLRLGFVAAAVVAAVLVLAWPRLPVLHAAAARARGPAAYALAALVSTGLVLAWAVRPAVMVGHIDPPIPTTATLQHAEGLATDATRSYSEVTMTWMTWYVGPLVLMLAIVGIAILIVRFVRDGDGVAGLVLTVTGIGTLMYLVAPQITPEQIWASRRFVPAAIPFLVLCAAASLDTMLTVGARTSVPTVVRRAGIPAAAALLLVFPIGSTLPVRSFSSQEGYLPLVEATCKRVGPHAAVLFARDDIEKLTLLQTMRSHCGATAAQARGRLTAARITQTAAAWHARGRDLWVLGSNALLINSVAPGLHPKLVGSATSRHNLAKTLTRYPSSYATQTLTIFAARVAPRQATEKAVGSR